MFSKAVEKVERFIRPVVICKRCHDGSVSAEGATLVIINKEGWFLSAAHKFEVIPLFKKHLQEMAAFTAKAKKLKEDDSKAARRELKRLRPNPRWITASSVWPGADDQNIVDIDVIPEADLLLGRLEPFDPASIDEYPVFKDPQSGLKAGTSLCKIGFSYTELATTYDHKTNKFDLDFKNLVPSPVDGIYTKDILFRTPEERKIPIKFIETSSPGLRGQTGGAVFDSDGRIWAIHSRTHHLPLDTNAKVKEGTREREVEQFLSVSWAVHPEVIVGFLKERGIEFSME